MNYRNGNYCAFYVNEPFCDSNLGANQTHDFIFYNMLRMWKGQDYSFPFIDSHNKTYNVRDGSSWEYTLKPRLHERLNNSKNIILFLSSVTKNSRALSEEINYGIKNKGLPIIVIYPDYRNCSSLIKSDGTFQQSIIDLWDKLPSLRDNMYLVPTLHIPFNKEKIIDSLYNENFMVNTKIKPNKYYY